MGKKYTLHLSRFCDILDSVGFITPPPTNIAENPSHRMTPTMTTAITVNLD
jgi:hypothetical protein